MMQQMQQQMQANPAMQQDPHGSTTGDGFNYANRS